MVTIDELNYSLSDHLTDICLLFVGNLFASGCCDVVLLCTDFRASVPKECSGNVFVFSMSRMISTERWAKILKYFDCCTRWLPAVEQRGNSTNQYSACSDLIWFLGIENRLDRGSKWFRRWSNGLSVCHPRNPRSSNPKSTVCFADRQQLTIIRTVTTLGLESQFRGSTLMQVSEPWL